MMYVWLTEYVADSAGFVYQQAGIMNYNVTANMVRLVLYFGYQLYLFLYLHVHVYHYYYYYISVSIYRYQKAFLYN